jgi:hypothetical protein
MRLTDKDGKVLWGDVVYSSRYASSATSRPHRDKKDAPELRVA